MPNIYHEINKIITTRNTITSRICLELLKYIFLFGIIQTTFEAERLASQNKNTTIMSMLVFLIGYRITTLYQRIRVHNSAVILKGKIELNKDEIKILSGITEKYIKGVTSFATWSLGVVLTIMILTSNTILTVYKDHLTIEEINKFFESSGNLPIQEVFFLPIYLVVYVLAIYMLLQSFTYNKRFFNSVLWTYYFMNKSENSENEIKGKDILKYMHHNFFVGIFEK